MRAVRFLYGCVLVLCNACKHTLAERPDTAAQCLVRICVIPAHTSPYTGMCVGYVQMKVVYSYYAALGE